MAREKPLRASSSEYIFKYTALAPQYVALGLTDIDHGERREGDLLAALRGGQLRARVYALSQQHDQGRPDALWAAASRAARDGTSAEGSELVRALFAPDGTRVGALVWAAGALGDGLLVGSAGATALHECELALGSLAAAAARGCAGGAPEACARAASLLEVTEAVAAGALRVLALPDDLSAASAADALGVFTCAAHAAHALGEAAQPAGGGAAVASVTLRLR
ncbi:hypothetical protein T492DRAFT_875002 [Pavlovales sp. CCMP2436]|nr:hypothetical protein T492DRAFT_875002 [Pavlovales sp. CCMP2436]